MPLWGEILPQKHVCRSLCCSREHAAVVQICLQLAYIFTPISATISRLTEALLAYLALTGYTHVCKRSEERPRAPDPDGAAGSATGILAPDHLARAWGCSHTDEGHSSMCFDGKPCEYLTPWLPRVMFDHIASLVSIGMGIDEVARSHGIRSLKALDVIKHQVCTPCKSLFKCA